MTTLAQMAFNHIAVIGGGAWGTALALTCARAGRQVTLWEQDAANAEQLKSKRESVLLPGVRLDDSIVMAGTIAEAARAEAILLVVPAQAVRAAATALSPLLAAGTPVIVCAKGIERGSKKFMSEVIAECAPKAVAAILSGPSFAADVARGLPTAVTLAAGDGKLAGELAQAVGSAAFRPYHSSDVRGVEIGGAAKNVLAIAAGVVTGRGLGASALGGADHARLCRTGSLRSRLWREAGNHDGPFRARRSPADLLQPAVAQFFVRRQSRPRRKAGCDPRRPCRRRIHRAGAARNGARSRDRHADLVRGGRAACGKAGRRRGHRVAVDAAAEGGGMTMAYWLMKTEPEEFSWDDQVKRGKKGEPWSGVRNFTARRHLKEMKKGDKFFFYHTGDEKQVVGIGEIIREAYPDPTAKAGEPWVAVTHRTRSSHCRSR